MRLLLPLLVLLAACGPTARMKMRAQRDTRTLGTAAQDYWMALRWGDIPGASSFLETPEQRLQLGKLLADPQVRLTDASLVHVVLGAELPEDRAPETREGVALVRVEAYDVRSGRVDARTLEQHWVRVGNKWQVDAEQSPLGVDRPW
jgi:hypothetical protein